MFHYSYFNTVLPDDNEFLQQLNALPAGNRAAFISSHPSKVNARNLATCTACLEEKDRQMFVINHTQHVNPQNLVAILKLGSEETRTVWLAAFSAHIKATNFKLVIGQVPQEFQLAFLELNEERWLLGKTRAVYREHVAMLSDKNDRYTFFQLHPLKMCNPQEDIYSVAWVMEQFTSQHALEVAKKHVNQINDVAVFQTFLNCNALDLASRVALIEAYLPTMLKQKDKIDQTFKVRKYLAEHLKLATGKDYPRGDHDDLQGLHILISQAKSHLASMHSNHDPKLFDAANQQSAEAMDVDRSAQYRPSA